MFFKSIVYMALRMKVKWNSFVIELKFFLEINRLGVDDIVG